MSNGDTPDLYQPLERECKECGEMFVLSSGEIDYFEKRALTLPKRCAPCRKIRREQRESTSALESTEGERGR